MTADGGAQMEILLVEDEKFHQVMAKKYLDRGNLKHRLHIVEDGEDAMDFLNRRGSHGTSPRPDIILLDLGLPKLDGREVFHQIKTDPNLMEIPVIVLSGTDSEEIDEEIAHNPASFCFTKWMEMEYFMTLIKTVQKYRAAISKNAA